MKGKLSKLLLAMATVAFAAALAIPAMAFAEDVTEIDLSQRSYTIESGGDYRVSSYTGANTLTVKADATVTLHDVEITAAVGFSAISVEGGNVVLVVEGENKLVGGDDGAGIYVDESASLTIKDADQSEDKLTAVGNAGVDDASGAAGIGGAWAKGNSGAITIDGATVVAEGYGVRGSGVGSGSGKVVGEIKIINGANVTAVGGYYANGAGVLLQSDYGKSDPEGGAAIGGGGKTASTIANITVADSTVVANGGSKAAGIGANFWCSCGTIAISGDSNVTAQGGSSSAAIGTSRAGDTGVSASIVISGGTVKAAGGAYGAGIGGGYNADSLGNGADASALPEISVAISGGAVTATGGEGGAGIGGGYKTDNVNIDITGGSVIAQAGTLVSGKTVENGGAACAIGSGANGSGKFENTPAVAINESATIEVTAYEGGKPLVEGAENAVIEARENVTARLFSKPVNLDFTDANDDESGQGWSWSHATKTLALTGFNYNPVTDDLIKVPDGSTIVLSGENKMSTAATDAIGIYVAGAVTIKGGGSLDISLGGGNALYAEKAGGDASIAIEGVTLTANGGIATADSAENASLILKDASVNIGRNSVSIRNDNGTRGENGKAGTATISMDNSGLYTGPVFVGAHLSSNHSYTRSSAVFAMTNGSSIDVQGGGKAAMIFVWGDCGVDFDVMDSNVKIWNSGWQERDINIQGGNDYYGVAGTEGVTLDVNIERSNLDMYGYWSGLNVARYYGDSADIKFNMDESTVSTMTKYGSSGISIDEATATGATERSITDSITFLTNDPGHFGTGMEVNATMFGSPVVHQDFTVVMQTGGTNDFSTVNFDFVLGEGQTLTIEEGKTFTSAKPITLSLGAFIEGNYVGEVIAPEGYEIVASGEGDKKVISVQQKTPVAKVGEDEYLTLPEAVAEANTVEGGATVTLLKDVTLGEKLTISGDVTIEGEYGITRADDYAGTLFAVNAGATLTLDGGLTIDGGNEWTMDMSAYNADLESFTKVSDGAKYFTPEEGAPVATEHMITVSDAGSTVNLNKVTIKNHYANGENVIVFAKAGATVNLTGAQITHNAITSGSGLVVNASSGKWDTTPVIWVNMNEGTVIDGNHVGGNHGVFKVYMGTVFTMNGGTIKNTTGWNSNGVAVGVYWATFNMKGGEICSNSSVYGPNNGRNAPVYLHSAHIFTMTGGSICHNTGGSRSGLDAPYADSSNNGTATITGGYIGENSSYYHDHGVEGYNPDITAGDKLTISGGTFTQNVDEWCVDGYEAVYKNGVYEVMTEEAADRYYASLYVPSAPSEPACGPEAACNAFNDVDAGAWYHEVIDWAYANGILRGYDDGSGNVGPEDATLRSHVMAMLHRMAGEPAAAADPGFNDVAEGAWYYEAVAWAKSVGLTTGYADGSGNFGPNDVMTREQMATVLYRFAALNGVDVSVGEDTNNLSYEDFSEISEWAIPAMQWAVGAGIVSGYTDADGEPTGYLGPKDDAERAHFAAMLMRLDAKHGIL